MKLTLSMIFAAVILLYNNVFSAPQAEFKSTTFDCGVVIEGKTNVLHAEFELKNTGDEDLKVTNVRPTCGCTVVKFDSTVAPGKSIILKSDVNIKGYHAGPVSKSIAFTSNSKKDPTVKLVIKAQIVAAVSVDKVFISLGTKTKTEPYIMDVLSIKKDIDITDVKFKVTQSSDAGSWQASLPVDIKYSLSPSDTVRSDNLYVHKLKMYTPVLKGVHHGTFIIETNNPDKKSIDVQGIIEG